MVDTEYVTHELIVSAAKRLTGHKRRLYVAEVTTKLCGGSARCAESRFGWGRVTIEKGLRELETGVRIVDNFSARGRSRMEELNPQLAIDITSIVDPHTQTDPTFKTSRRYLNLSAREVIVHLRERGYTDDTLPNERTMRNILNRMNFRLRKTVKAKPFRKTKDTDEIFANVHEVKQKCKDDPEILEISMDTKAKVDEGDYVRGGKKPDGS